jgi:hypothetical protein
MPLLFLLVGLILVVTAIRGTTGDFASHLSQDVDSGFVKWLAAIVVVGLIGYIPGLKEPSRYLMALVAVVIFLTSGSGFLDQFAQQIENPPAPTQGQQAGASTSGASSNQTGLGSAVSVNDLANYGGLLYGF